MSNSKKNKKSTDISDEKQGTGEKYLKNPEILLQILPIIFHKLKNKLTPILGYAQMLKSSAENEFVATRLQKIENGALDFTELLNKLKEYFKLDKGPMQKTNLNSILTSMKEVLESKSREHGITFKLELAPDIPDSMLYPEEIYTLVAELVSNAVQSLQKKDAKDKTISVSTQLIPESGFCLKVRDNGTGVSQENLDKVWTPFYTTEENHAGLGLVLCEKIIANHTACCKIESVVGDFCEFAVSFPVKGLQ